MLQTKRDQKKRHSGFAIARLVAVLALLITLAGPYTTQFANAATVADTTSATTLVSIKGNVVPAVANHKATVASALNPNQTLNIGLTISQPYPELLQEWLRQVYSPNSPNYGRFLSAQQFDAKFAPSQADQDAVVKYLQSQGLNVYKTYANHSLILAKGTVAQVQTAFNTTINNYRLANGQTFYANAAAPALPASIASKILNVQGLDNQFAPVHSQITASKAATSKASGGGPNGGLTPSQWQSFYNFNSLYSSNLNGQGQIMALVEFDGFRSSDFTAFLQHYSLPSVPVEVRGAGSSYYNVPGSGETQVISDLEMAAATVPNVSKLVVYEELGNAFTTAFQEFVNDDDAAVLNSSWDIPCDTAQPTSLLAAETQVLQQAAAQGQTVVQASGDDAGYSCSNGSLPANVQNNNPSIGSPEDNPYVLSVGGTSINFASNPTTTTLTYSTETAWDCPQTDTASQCNVGNVGTGGGVSNAYFGQPWWQHGVTDGVSTTGRAIPDVALYADVRAPADTTIEPGYSVYCADVNCAVNPGWLQVGGTTVVSPVTAGMVLMAVQAKGSRLGFINPTIYALGQGNSASSIFHDVTSGSNGAYKAGTGWDATTGFGSFDANALVNALKTTTAPTTPSASAPVFNYYVPFAAGSKTANTYDTALYIQNESANSSSLNVTFYSPSGSVLGTQSPTNGNINGHGQFLINQGTSGPLSTTNGPNIAAAVVQSSQPLNIMVTEYTPSGASAYNAISNVADYVDQLSSSPGQASSLPFASSNVLLPIVENGLFKTTLNVFNGGVKATTVTVTYYDGATGNQVATENRAVAANGSVSIDNSASGSVVPANFSGSAVVSSSDGVPLSVQVIESRSDIHFTASYPGVGVPGLKVFAPAIYNNTFSGFFTGMNIVNPSGDQNVDVTITYYKEDGTQVGTQTLNNIGPHAIVGVFHGNTNPSAGVVLPTGVSMSAVVQADGPVAITVNEAGTGSLAGAYSGLLAGSTSLNLPVIQSNFYGGTSGLVVQNLGSTAVNASLQYYDVNGNAVGTPVALTIPAHGIINQYDDANSVPGKTGGGNGFVGNAVVTGPADSELVVTCNVSNAGAPGVTTPYFYSYTAP